MIRRSLITLVLLLLLSISVQPPSVKADSLPENAYIKGVKGHPQTYSLSCESRSAVDWAAYWDVNIRERKFLSALPHSDNPDRGMVGHPGDAWGNIPPNSYGVHAEPVAALLREYGLDAVARRGMEWDELRVEVAAGRPVIVWVIGQVWRGIPVHYKARDGSKTTVARFEHTMILIGYDDTSVQLVDAYSGDTQTHPLKNFLASWKTLGNMAITGQAARESIPPEEEQHHTYLPALFGTHLAASLPQPTTNNSQTYVVQRGDFLVGVARQLSVNWRKLANLNHLEPPYIIFPGQKLMIP